MKHALRLIGLVALLVVCAPARAARAEERLCDASLENCRAPLLNLINAETVGIDVAFWFMEDSRYATALINRWNAGVPVRVIMDTEANDKYVLNADALLQLKQAGIPMLEKTTGGIVHWKTMIFAGQNVVEFSGANYSPHAFVPVTPLVDFIDEVIYFCDDPAIVSSFKTKYDDWWTAASGFTPYANITAPRVRVHPTFAIDPQMNFPPGSSSVDFGTRSVKLYNAETVAIDSQMFRITDRRHADALIAAKARGVSVRLITEPGQYRDPERQWHSWNVDRMYMAGIEIRQRAHMGGENAMHEKVTLLRGLATTIFGSSNWTSPSANSQLEHNIFTKKPLLYDFFTAQFERKWTNATGNVETEPFVPLPPDAPVYQAPANASQNQSQTITLRWFGGYFAHLYDLYMGTDPANLVLVAPDLALGPSQSATEFQSYTVSGLELSTTYYWKIVSKTAANLSRSGPVWSFRTTGVAPAAGPLDAVLYAWKAPAIVGNWQVVNDPSAAGGARLSNPNLGAARAAASAAPADYFEMTFNADAGVPYRVWIRGKAASNNFNNDSVWVQFSDSVTSAGTPNFQIGTTLAANVTIEDCSGCGLSNWGWNDNAVGVGALGPQIFFAASGAHTIRVSVREDGLSVDQIVLSRDVYLDAAPGLAKDDGTIVKESPGGTSGAPPPPPAPDIVLHARSAILSGAWQLVDDAAAADGKAAVLQDLGRPKVTAASATPTDYFEITFTALANTPYHLWVRGRATGNIGSNDSVHLQFTDAITADGTPMAGIGTKTSVEFNLEQCSGCGLSGWGWEDNGWGSPTALGPEIRFAADGLKTIRVQNREDGLLIDQIVLSPVTYMRSGPGPAKGDQTILPATDGGEGEPPPPPPPPPPSEPATDIVLHVTGAKIVGTQWQLVDLEDAASGKAIVLPDAGRSKVTTPVASPTNYVELTFKAVANTPYRLWIRGRAEGNAATNDSVHVQFNDAVNASGSPVARIGTASSYEVNLEDCSGCGNSGWGWEDNGWGTPTTLGPEVRFATDGVKTIRIQNREDGFYIDQIVLSPSTWLTLAPGANQDDTTVLTPTP